MKKVLVTGCAGFVGFHLAKSLLKKNTSVIGIDNIDRAYSTKFKKENISNLLKFSHFTFYKNDITRKKSITRIFREHTPTHVVHLAARAGIRKSIQFPKLYATVNVAGTEIIYILASKYGAKQFIYASSSSVYGNSRTLPFSEKNLLPKPPSPYAASKIQAEKILKRLSKKHTLPTTVLRFFSVYGPYGRPNMAPYIFTKAALCNTAITQFGDGTTARDHTYIDDIIFGISKALTKPFSFEIVNLGNSHPISLNRFIETTERLTKRKIKRIILPRRKEESIKTWADIGKAKKLLGWKPTTPFDVGMSHFVTWFRKNRLQNL